MNSNPANKSKSDNLIDKEISMSLSKISHICQVSVTRQSLRKKHRFDYSPDLKENGIFLMQYESNQISLETGAKVKKCAKQFKC
jgi:ribosomal protein L24